MYIQEIVLKYNFFNFPNRIVLFSACIVFCYLTFLKLMAVVLVWFAKLQKNCNNNANIIIIKSCPFPTIKSNSFYLYRSIHFSPFYVKINSPDRYIDQILDDITQCSPRLFLIEGKKIWSL